MKLGDEIDMSICNDKPICPNCHMTMDPKEGREYICRKCGFGVVRREGELKGVKVKAGRAICPWCGCEGKPEDFIGPKTMFVPIRKLSDAHIRHFIDRTTEVIDKDLKKNKKKKKEKPMDLWTRK
jgi:hypothetical protein